MKTIWDNFSILNSTLAISLKNLASNTNKKPVPFVPYSTTLSTTSYLLRLRWIKISSLGVHDHSLFPLLYENNPSGFRSRSSFSIASRNRLLDLEVFPPGI
ncbi:5838_t:CDS:1 [Ambispora gerdemannii]|uniref:5838_t:CDS:1 n=1 Tax=Ambispora gerdemannii TaxID=144530 RepID=A0A9N9GDG7_9GLOM|nr:5838_t:CDS:1 [Ambispora gerdemannii]